MKSRENIPKQYIYKLKINFKETELQFSNPNFILLQKIKKPNEIPYKIQWLRFKCKVQVLIYSLKQSLTNMIIKSSSYPQLI